MTTSFNALCELPFHDLHHQEFIRATGAWVHHTPTSLLNSKDLFQDTIESPEKKDDLRSRSNENYSKSKYCTVKQSGTLFQQKAVANCVCMLVVKIEGIERIY